MSFLSSVGKGLVTAGKVAANISTQLAGLDPIFGKILPPALGQMVHTVESDLERLAGVIVQVEAFGQALQLPGLQKLTAATPLVAQALLKSALLAGKKIADPQLFQQGAKKIADGLADVLNSVHEDEAKA